MTLPAAPIVQLAPRDGRALVTIDCSACGRLHTLTLDPTSPPLQIAAPCGADVALSVHPNLAAGHTWEPGDPNADDQAERTPRWVLPPTVKLQKTAEKLATRVKALNRVHPIGHLTATVRIHVLEILQQHGPATDRDIVTAYQGRVDAREAPAAAGGTVRTARAQLVRFRKVLPTGEKRPTPAGRTAKVWKAAN